jgi:hypothetical protein
MPQIHLNFYQRITLWNMIGNHPCRRLQDTAVFLRLLDRVRPSDEEMRDTQFVQQEQQFMWRTPSPNYGERDIEIESDEAKALVEMFEAQEGIRVADAAWIFRLIDPLRSKNPEALPPAPAPAVPMAVPV